MPRSPVERQACLVEKRRALRRGRPKGSTVPLLQHPRRFETALWLTLTKVFDWGPTEAANAVAGIMSDRPIDAGTVHDVLLRLGTGIPNATLRGRSDRISRRARAAIEAASPKELDWLIESGAALMQLWTYGVEAAQGAYAVDTLRTMGWGPTLAAIAGRLQVALRSTNLPPIDEPISRKVQRLMATVAAESEPRQ